MGAYTATIKSSPARLSSQLVVELIVDHSQVLSSHSPAALSATYTQKTTTTIKAIVKGTDQVFYPLEANHQVIILWIKPGGR